MRLPQWFENIERRNWQRLTPKQTQTIERTWQKASRHGMAAYILMRGTVLFLWSALCLVFFSWRGHTLPIMRQTFYLAAVIPCLLLFSFAIPTIFYLLFRHNVRKLHARQAGGITTA